MKKLLFLTIQILALAFILSACQIFDSAVKEPPIVENEQWKAEILGMEEFNEPLEFVCSDCDLTSRHSRLTLQDKKTYLKVTVHITNKTSETQTAPDENIGILLSSSVYGCGGLTLAGANYCLPSGMIRNEMKYVNYGINTPDFKQTLLFEPNAEGEILDFIFIVRKNSNYKLFYFADLEPLDISQIKVVKAK